MAKNFEIEGLKELEKALLDLGPELGFKTLRSAGREAMKPVLASAQKNVHVDSGDTHDALAISAKKGKGNTSVFINVGATKTKATKKQGGRKFVNVNQKVIAQEFGTKKQEADPFLRPALENNANKVLSGLKNSLADKIEKAAKKLAKGA
jgi:HK97 gp10 family phage protein